MIATGRSWRAIADYWAGDNVIAIRGRYGYAVNSNIAAMAWRHGFRRRLPDTRSKAARHVHRMPDPLRKTISATQAPALFNVSPYVHALDALPAVRQGRRHRRRPSDARMSWGKKLQPLIIAQAAEELRLEVQPNADDVYHRRGCSAAPATPRSSAPTAGPARSRRNACSTTASGCATGTAASSCRAPTKSSCSSRCWSATAPAVTTGA
jgi:hypothetical protein